MGQKSRCPPPPTPTPAHRLPEGWGSCGVRTTVHSQLWIRLRVTVDLFPFPSPFVVCMQVVGSEGRGDMEGGF